jgi:hypothetical protein
MDAHAMLEDVEDMETFFAFTRALIKDRNQAEPLESLAPAAPRGPDAGAWQNTTISTYLDAALAWAESTSMGLTQGVPGSLSWRAFAEFLYAGKIYE